jgi:two-component sensor histidine kinase
LAAEELAPFVNDHERRIEIGGPPLMLKPAAAQSLALVLHELATNAAKYGALSRTGRVEFCWFCPDGDDRVPLTWREIGGAPAPTSSRSGFGSRLIKARIERQMRGLLDYDWKAEGLTVSMSIPKENVSLSRPAGV